MPYNFVSVWRSAGRSAVIVAAVLAAAVFPAACDGGSGASPQGEGTVLFVTDLHFSPFTDPALFPRLKAAAAEDWEEIFRSGARDWGGFGDEMTYTLWNSAVESMADAAARADMVVYLGDVLCHDFKESFHRLLGTEDQEEFEDFTAKTYRYVLGRLSDALPGRDVVFVLGNNDYYCGDYRLAPGGDFLADTASVAARGLNLDSDQAGVFRQTWRRGGYYAYTRPGEPGLEIIALNAVFFSLYYRNSCGPQGNAAPGREQLAWLEARLEAARAENRKVWLMLHIPPGMNVYGTIHQHMQPDGSLDGAEDFWTAEFGGAFQDLVRRYADVLSASFSGHTHQDDFRVDPDRSLFTKIVPALTPIFYNNPGYMVATYDRRTLAFRGYTAYYLDLAGLNDPAGPAWNAEYKYRTAYNLESLNAPQLRMLHRLLPRDEGVRRVYRTYYDVSNREQTPMSDPDHFKAYWCGQSEWTAEGFLNCCRAPLPDRGGQQPAR